MLYPPPEGMGTMLYKDKLYEVACPGEITLQKTNATSISSVVEDHRRGPLYHTCQNPSN